MIMNDDSTTSYYYIMLSCILKHRGQQAQQSMPYIYIHTRAPSVIPIVTGINADRVLHIHRHIGIYEYTGNVIIIGIIH